MPGRQYDSQGTSRHTSWTAAAGLLLLLGGCQSDQSTKEAEPRRISLAQFSSPLEVEPFPQNASADMADGDSSDASATRAADPGAGDFEPRAVESPVIAEAAQAETETSQDDDRASPPVVNPPAARRTNINAMRPGERVLVDSLIGQVHGRPIFAHDVLGSIEGTLRSIAQSRATSGEARDLYREAVRRSFYAMVQDQLMLADAESKFTREQRLGFLRWLTSLKEDVRRQLGQGSQSVTEERLREEGEADSIEEFVGARRDDSLINMQIKRNVIDRVIVSWRDIEREYERIKDDLNPPPSMRLNWIVLSNTTDADEITYVNERLAAGESFEVLAERYDIQPQEPFKLDAEGRPTGLRGALQDAAAQLGPGETSTAIDMGAHTAWVHVYSIDRPEEKTIYDRDVQFSLRDRLLYERRFAEQARYIDRLENRDKNTDLVRMEERLLEIAWRRYYR